MNTVMKEVDVRAFPMLIAKRMLELGNAFNMGLGIVSYNEAEIKLEIWLQVLNDYRMEFWDTPILIDQKHALVRFIQLHTNNHNLKESLARQLLDFINYFPVATEYPYQEKFTDGEN